jgi:hypothetical protein
MPQVMGSELLLQAEDALALVESAMAELRKGEQERRLAAVRNVAAFGREVMKSLRQLCTLDAGFADWFQQNAGAMLSDPMMQEFSRASADLLTGRGLELNVTQLTIASAGARFGARPKAARAFFTGDRLGGSGWELVLRDGSVEKYYMMIPESIRPPGLRFRSEPPSDDAAQCVEELANHYTDYLREMIRAGRQLFGG